MKITSRNRQALLAVALTVGLTACGGPRKQAPTSASGNVRGVQTERSGAQPAPEPVLVQVSTDPGVTLAAWFHVGSRHDPAGKEGLAWLTGQVIAEGATEKHSYPEILEALFPMAAAYGTSVDREMTVVMGRAHRDHFDPFLRLFSDAYTAPAFKDEDIERLRAEGISALEETLRYASDEELGKAALVAAVFAGTAYENPVVGTVAGLRAITRGDVVAFYEKHYARGGATFGLGGGFTQEDVTALEGTRAGLPAGVALPSPPAPEPVARTGWHVTLVEKPDADASLSFGFPIDVVRGDDDFYALWVASSWLGEHRNQSSHLYKVIRERRGLNYGDYAYIEAFPNGGFFQMPPTNVARKKQMFQVWIRTLPSDKAVFALRAALRELRDLVENGLSEEEFETAQSFLSRYVTHFAPDSRTRLGYAIDDRFYGIDDGHLARARRRIAALTRAEVNAAIQKHLSMDDIHFAIVTGQPQLLEEQLVSGKPTPITYPVSKLREILEEDKLIAAEPLRVSPENVRIVPVADMFAR